MSDMENAKPQPCPACGREAKRTRCGDCYCRVRGCWVAERVGTLPVEYWNLLRLAPVASDETIPVRIAVVVDENGVWAARGYSDDDANRSETLAASQIRGSADSGIARTTFVAALAYKPQLQPAMEVQGDSESK